MYSKCMVRTVLERSIVLREASQISRFQMKLICLFMLLYSFRTNKNARERERERETLKSGLEVLNT